MADKRIIEQTASTTIPDDAFFIFDSALLGTFKISQSALLDFFGNATITEVTKAQYDALPDTKLTDGVLYAIKDQETSYVVDIEVNGSSILDEDGIADLSVISKIEDEIANAIAEEYDSTHTYYNTGLVFHEGVLYQCTASSVTGTWDSTKWNAVDIKDLLDNVSMNISYLWNVINNTIADNYDTSSTYDTGDYVIYGLKLYRCKADSVTGAWNSSKWDEVNIPEYIDYVLENAGIVKDVKVDGTSVVDENKVAQITTPDADGISYDNTTSGLEADDVQDAIDEVVTDIESVETALETKAEVDGFYDELYAGNLLSDNTETDNAPYLYRPSPSGKSYVDLSVVGGTVAWNQLVNYVGVNPSSQNNVTVTNNNDGSFTLANTSTGTCYFLIANLTTPQNHVFYIKGCPSGGSNQTYLMIIDSVANSSDVGNGAITKNTTTSSKVYIVIRSGVNCNNLVYKPQLIDLTQMFGSTIADYIYSLEQNTAGSGFAWLKSYGFLTKPYYAYQSGKLESVNVASREVVGKNLFDKNNCGVYNGYISSSQCYGSTNHRTIYIPCLPNTTYVIQNFSGNNRNTLTYSSEIPSASTSVYYSTTNTVTTDANAKYLVCYCYNANSDTVSFDDVLNSLDIEFGSKTPNSYEPYTTKTYPLDSDLTLRGIPKLDANNNLYYDGDIYKADGGVTRRYGVVDLGTLTFGEYGSTDDCTQYYTTALDTLAKVSAQVFSVKFIYDSQLNPWTMRITSGTTGKTYFRTPKDYYDSPSAFKTAMNGVYLVYELATPTSETADAFLNPQLVGSTEEFVDAGTSASTPTRDVAIPVGQDSKYHTDLKAKLDELAKIPDVPSTNGTYTLKATRSASGVVYNWVSG